jgi:uncharacterized protein YecE (DUF72 family)
VRRGRAIHRPERAHTMTMRRTFVGTAGWAIPKECAGVFPADGSALERYSTCFNATEINSSFHRRHRPSTWARWAASVPSDFRFSVKLPKLITHQRRLADCGALLDEFVVDVAPLADKMGVVLIQLPPSLVFDEECAAQFFHQLGKRLSCDFACEPRHASWFTPLADDILKAHRVARVAADPGKPAGAVHPGGTLETLYLRLHGSPVTYRTSYDEGRLLGYANAVYATLQASTAWVIFDNTASGAATGNALAMRSLLGRTPT